MNPMFTGILIGVVSGAAAADVEEIIAEVMQE